MRFVVSREALLKPLQLVSGVVERRQTLPILSNVLLDLQGDELSLTGTDLEVELIGRTRVESGSKPGSVTVPARKLVDICKSLPDQAQLECSVGEGRLTLKAGRSRFTLATLPADDFPRIEDEPGTFSVQVDQTKLKSLLDSTSFAMAQQDVRYYLNGMLFEVTDKYLRVVATDGHRLAMHTYRCENHVGGATQQLILPRKGIMELGRLLSEGSGELELVFGNSHIRARMAEFTFTSKLVDGKFPDYNRVLPKNGDKAVVGDRQLLRHAFSRTAILSNEKYRGVRIILSTDELKIMANNPEQEEAEETVAVDYQGEPLEIGFNVSYLIDVLGALTSEKVRIALSDSNSSALLDAADDSSDAVYVVMPMRL